jgi:pimeloyl-ACP methyl ester carboxylesterase
MAASYVRQNPDRARGLVLWAAYPGPGDDLSDWDGRAVVVFGTNDGLAQMSDVEDARVRLPPGARFVPIPGGNHSQFGYYGEQSGDNPAALPHSEQQASVVVATVQLLRDLEP